VVVSLSNKNIALKMQTLLIPIPATALQYFLPQKPAGQALFFRKREEPPSNLKLSFHAPY